MSKLFKEKFKNGYTHPKLGKKDSVKTKKLKSQKAKDYLKNNPDIRVGENNPNWRGGTSFEAYPITFNRKLKTLIKNRDKNRCFICKSTKTLCVHHINYKKEDCRPENLITLCIHCHTKTNSSREDWEIFFTKDISYRLSLAEMCDRMSILNLKSMILGCGNEVKKNSYEEEIHILMKDIHSFMKQNKDNIKNWGKLIRAIQLQQIMNRLIWENESKAREGGREQDYLLPFIHSVNSVRMKAGNMIINQAGGRLDLNLDRSVDEVNKKRGFNFDKIFA